MSPGPLDKDLRDTIKDLQDKIRRMIRDKHVPYGSSNANLYLALTKDTAARNWREKILRSMSVSSFFKLRPFGEPYDPMAASALYFAQWILSGIFIMELVGWTLLFNEVLNAGVLTLSFKTIPAIFFGWIFAIGIIALEQAILTAAVVDGWGKRKGTLLVRIVLIGCSAAITTQPYELLMFSSEVKDRIHQESVRAEITRHYPSYLEFRGGSLTVPAIAATQVVASNQQPEVPSGGSLGWLGEANQRCPPPDRAPPPAITGPGGDVFEAQKTDILRRFYTEHRDDCEVVIGSVPLRQKEIAAQVQVEASNRDSLSEQINQAASRCPDQRDSDSPCAQSLRGLRRTFDKTVGNIRNLQEESSKIQESLTPLAMNRDEFTRRIPGDGQPTTALSDLEGGAEATPEALRYRARLLQVYLGKLVISEPGAVIQLEPYRSIAEPPFRDQELGVTKKLRALYADLSGAPYLWNIDDKTKKAIESEFGLRDPAPGWTVYTFAPWAGVLIAAMFLPFVSLGYKLTLNDNLNLYYVTEYQAQLGNVGAIVATEAKRRFWENRAVRTKGRITKLLDVLFSKLDVSKNADPKPFEPSSPGKATGSQPRYASQPSVLDDAEDFDVSETKAPSPRVDQPSESSVPTRQEDRDSAAQTEGGDWLRRPANAGNAESQMLQQDTNGLPHELETEPANTREDGSNPSRNPDV